MAVQALLWVCCCGIQTFPLGREVLLALRGQLVYLASDLGLSVEEFTANHAWLFTELLSWCISAS